MRTLRCGLIGANIGRSRFSAALGLLCAEHGLVLEFQPIDTAGRAEFDLAGTVAELRARGWDGVAVTHPWKTAAAGLIGSSPAGPGSPAALGAVNTLIFSAGGPTGANTDYAGFLAAWRHRMGGTAPGRVAMAGAGGVARAIAPALAQLGATEIVVWDVDPARAAALARLAGPTCRAVPAAQANRAVAGADGLVNATACGMAGYPASAFALPLAARPGWAFDAVYTPVNTPFLGAARAAGARLLTGFDLFQHMALESFRTLTGIETDPADALSGLGALRPEEEHNNA